MPYIIRSEIYHSVSYGKVFHWIDCDDTCLSGSHVCISCGWIMCGKYYKEWDQDVCLQCQFETGDDVTLEPE